MFKIMNQIFILQRKFQKFLLTANPVTNNSLDTTKVPLLCNFVFLSISEDVESTYADVLRAVSKGPDKSTQA